MNRSFGAILSLVLGSPVSYVVILLCAGVAALLIFHGHAPHKPIRGLRKLPGVFAVNKNEIVGISMRETSMVELRKEGMPWKITSPVECRADRDEVDRLISAVLDLTVMKEADSTRPLDQYGLDRPSSSITVCTGNSCSTLILGSDSRDPAGIYAMVDRASKVLVIPANARDIAAQGMHALMDRHIMSMRPEDIAGIRVITRGLILSFTKGYRGSWTFADGSRRKADGRKMLAFIQEMAGARAISFSDIVRFDRAPDTIVEFFSGAHAQKIEMWRLSDKAYALTDLKGTLVEIAPEIMWQVPSDPEAMAERPAIRLDKDRLTEITITSGKKIMKIKQDNGWFVDNRKIHNSSVLNALIDTVKHVNLGDEYLLLPKDALLVLGIRLCSEDRTPCFDIALYSQYYMMVHGRIFHISEGDTENLAKSVDRLLKRYE